MSTESVRWAEVGETDGIPDALDSGLRSFLDYWHSLRAAHDRLPRKSEFDPLDIARLWRGIAVIEVIRREGQENRFLYRFLGTTHDHVNGASFSGRFIDETLPAEEVAALQPVYNHIIQERVPHYWHRRSLVPSMEPVAYERVLTPFLGTGDRVDFLIGFWRWRWRAGNRAGLRVVHDSSRGADSSGPPPVGG